MLTAPHSALFSTANISHSNRNWLIVHTNKLTYSFAHFDFVNMFCTATWMARTTHTFSLKSKQLREKTEIKTHFDKNWRKREYAKWSMSSQCEHTHGEALTSVLHFILRWHLNSSAFVSIKCAVQIRRRNWSKFIRLNSSMGQQGEREQVERTFHF